MATVSASNLLATEGLTPQPSPREAQSADLVSFPPAAAFMAFMAFIAFMAFMGAAAFIAFIAFLGAIVRKEKKTLR